MAFTRTRQLSRLLFSLSLCASPVFGGEENQPHATILDTVRNYLENQVVPAGSDYRIDVSPIESRLQLARCDGALEAFSLGETRRTGMVTVGVRCQGSMPWTVYTRARVGVYQTVLVLRESLSKDTIITADHLDFAKKDISELNNGYFTAPEQAIGKLTKRTLPAGTVLADNVLGGPKIIRRGDLVKIHLRNTLLDVHMDGSALTDAEVGQRVKVRNEHSKRIIEGTAVAPGVVQVE